MSRELGGGDRFTCGEKGKELTPYLVGKKHIFRKTFRWQQQ